MSFSKAVPFVSILFMKKTGLFLSLFAALTISTAFAGPAPDTYVGDFTRIAPAAKPKLASYDCTATAYNPTEAMASNATHVIFNASQGVNESVRCKVMLLPSGQLDFDLSGKVRSRTTGKLIRFTATGLGNATVGATSFSSNIRKGELRRNTPAQIEVSARSEETNLFVTFTVRGKGRHPLGFYSGSFAGAAPVEP